METGKQIEAKLNDRVREIVQRGVAALSGLDAYGEAGQKIAASIALKKLEGVANTHLALRKVLDAAPREVDLALSVLLARRGGKNPPLDFVVAAAKQVACLALDAPEELVAELDAASERFAAFTCEGAATPDAPTVGQLWWVEDGREFGGEGLLVVEDVDLAADPIEVVFQRDNCFDRSSMEWPDVVAATKRGTGFEYERFVYLGQAPPELRDDYVRPSALVSGTQTEELRGALTGAVDPAPPAPAYGGHRQYGSPPTKYDLRDERGAFERAEKVPACEYKGWVSWDGATVSSRSGTTEGYFRSVDELIEACAEDGEELPAFVWATTETHLSLDADNILESALEEHHEEARAGISREAERDLQALLDVWVARTDTKVTTYMEDRSRAVVLGDEERARWSALVDRE